MLKTSARLAAKGGPSQRPDASEDGEAAPLRPVRRTVSFAEMEPAPESPAASPRQVLPSMRAVPTLTKGNTPEGDGDSAAALDLLA